MPVVLEQSEVGGRVDTVDTVVLYDAEYQEDLAAAREFGFSTVEELDAFFKEVDEDARLGRGRPADEVIAEIRAELGL
jgi:hypothetical protein